MKYSWSLVELFFSRRFLCAVISTYSRSVFVLSGRTKRNATESNIGQTVCYQEMTFEQVYLKMMISVVSSRTSGAARPGCPPPLYPPTEVALNTAPSVFGFGSKHPDREEISPETRRKICGEWGRRARDRTPKMSFVWRRKQFKEAGGGSAVDTGDGRGAS